LQQYQQKAEETSEKIQPFSKALNTGTRKDPDRLL